MVHDVTIQVNETTDGDDEDFMTSSGSGDTSTSIETTAGFNEHSDDSNSPPLSTLAITIMAAVFAALVVCLLISLLVYFKRRLKKPITRETELTTVSSMSGPSQANSSSTVLPIVSTGRMLTTDSRGRPIHYDNTADKGLTRRGNSHNDSNASDFLTTEVHIYEKIS